MLEGWFKLAENRTTLRREIVAGITTFAAMAYILAVNPAVLSTTGMDRGALITATALASALATALMALMTNYPIALAPGMGINAFFAFTVCGAMKIPWQAALGLVFWDGVLFLALTVTGIRRRIVSSIPHQLKLAITCGIGLFILFIGLKNGGVIVSNPATFVTLGNLSKPEPLLVLGGIVLTGVLVARRVPGAIIVSVVLISLVGLFIPGAEGPVSKAPSSVVSLPASIAPTFLAFDLFYLFKHFAFAFPIVLALLFVDMFDTMGTLIGVSERAGFLDKDGNLPRLHQALNADAGATIIGACLGTSTTTSYIESAAGVEEGGRTGLTGLVVSACFLLALFFHPLIGAIPAIATAPALVIVGVYMMQTAREIDLSDFAIAVPAVLTMVVMPFAFSISDGLAVGFVAYAALMIFTGRFRDLSVLAYILAALFVAHLVTR